MKLILMQDKLVATASCMPHLVDEPLMRPLARPAALGAVQALLRPMLLPHHGAGRVQQQQECLQAGGRGGGAPASQTANQLRSCIIRLSAAGCSWALLSIGSQKAAAEELAVVKQHMAVLVDKGEDGLMQR